MKDRGDPERRPFAESGGERVERLPPVELLVERGVDDVETGHPEQREERKKRGGGEIVEGGRNREPSAQRTHGEPEADAEVGERSNLGAGTITCNYDGVKKHRTVIGDDVFVGSDVQFVAPVTIGSNSLIAAGTTVTRDVPPDSLAIARTPQVNKEGWKLRKKTSD